MIAAVVSLAVVCGVLAAALWLATREMERDREAIQSLAGRFADALESRQEADNQNQARLLDRIQAPDAVRATLWPVLDREPDVAPDPEPQPDPDDLIAAEIAGTAEEE